MPGSFFINIYWESYYAIMATFDCSNMEPWKRLTLVFATRMGSCWFKEPGILYLTFSSHSQTAHKSSSSLPYGSRHNHCGRGRGWHTFHNLGSGRTSSLHSCKSRVVVTLKRVELVKEKEVKRRPSIGWQRWEGSQPAPSPSRSYDYPQHLQKSK